MKSKIAKSLALFTLSVLMLIFSSQSANAQEKRLSSSPQDFKIFFTKFRRAIERNDKNGVASMTRFPFSYGFDAGDEGTMTKTQFIRRFSEIFGESPKSFFTEKNPGFARENSKYYISTEDAAHLMFIKQGKTFKFVSYIVEP